MAQLHPYRRLEIIGCHQECGPVQRLGMGVDPAQQLDPGLALVHGVLGLQDPQDGTAVVPILGVKGMRRRNIEGAGEPSAFVFGFLDQNLFFHDFFSSKTVP